MKEKEKGQTTVNLTQSRKLKIERSFNLEKTSVYKEVIF
jgi:hypothetical protein